jgi:hypothetical protein
MDYYLRTKSKEEFIEDLKRIGINITLEKNYFQNKNIIVDWIGLIPNDIQYENFEITDEDDELVEPLYEITYKEGQHVNIRSIEEIDITKFENTKDVYPEIPYRIFS